MNASKRAVEALFTQNLSIASAESCTGGMIASEIVSYAGISDHFKEGFITYSNEAKVLRLGVDPDVIERYGAVSEETARAMAFGVRMEAESDIGIASTGIAGPGGGTEIKPVGLVYLSCAIGEKIITRGFKFPGNRYQVRYAATREAFKLIADAIEKFGDNT